MADFLTRGQPRAVDAVRAMLRLGPPQAVLLLGPDGVGKTTLALDIAAAILCIGGEPGDRPCGTCRGCRMARSGNHPDLHRLAPEGAGGQIRIGDRQHPERGSVRGLIAELSLLPVEGGWRVAVIEAAQRMNEDAQSALLKTLEEPPARTLLVLCADDEDRLLPTVRSRCARVRLGPLAGRDVEGLLSERRAADPPLAARLARVTNGRPGIALQYAAHPDALRARDEIARTLLDLVGERRGRRLAIVNDLQRQAAELVATLDAATSPVTTTTTRGRGKGAVAPKPAASPPAATPESAGEAPSDASETAEVAARATASERRRGAIALVGIWRDVARDLAVAQLGRATLIRDAALLDDLTAAAARVGPGEAARFVDRLARMGELLEANVSPELALDVLALAWPAASTARAGGAAT